MNAIVSLIEISHTYGRDLEDCFDHSAVPGIKLRNRILSIDDPNLSLREVRPEDVVNRLHFGHGIQRKKGLSLQPPDSAAGKGLNHSTLAAVPSWATIGRARLNPSGLSRAKGRTPRFLGRETLEKPDNDLSITPHFAVYKGFGASAPKVFTLVQENFTLLQQKFDNLRFRPPKEATFTIAEG